MSRKDSFSRPFRFQDFNIRGLPLSRRTTSHERRKEHSAKRLAFGGERRYVIKTISLMIYFDHNATTPVLPEVVEAMMPFFREKWGNPSSSYRFGSRLKKILEPARE